MRNQPKSSKQRATNTPKASAHGAAHGAHVSIGARQLTQCGSTREVARRIGRSASLVGMVGRGERDASDDLRTICHDVLGIEPVDFDRFDDDPVSEMEPGDSPAVARIDATARERLQAALGEYDALLGGTMAPGARVAMMRARDACAERLSRVDGLQISESTIMRHPCMASVFETMGKTVAPCPICTVRLADRFHVLEFGENPGREASVRQRFPQLFADLELAMKALDDAARGVRAIAIGLKKLEEDSE